MKKFLLSFLSLTAILNFSFSQVIYQNTTNQGSSFNIGNNSQGHPFVLFDDANIPAAQVAGSDSVAITQVKYGISRAVGAPAVTINFYYSPANPNTTNVSNQISVPPVKIGTYTFTSANNSTYLDTTITVGDGVTPIFSVKTRVGTPYANYQTLFLGLSFSTNVSGGDNGWKVATPSQSYNYDRIWVYDPDANAAQAASLGTTVYSTFNLQVSGYAYGGTLPITLSNFRGVRSGTVSTLNWSTESEQNNRGFEIQRSIDGNNFSTISFVNSKATNGNSVSKLDYQFVDNKALSGDFYYRLRQLDLEGKESISSVVLLKGNIANTLALSNVYPNPANRNLNIVITAPVSQKVTFVVTDLAGKVVMQHFTLVNIGDNNISLNVTNLAKGTYLLKAVCPTGCETTTTKFVKQ